MNGIIVLKYALTDGPFLIIPGKQYDKDQCNALVQIYEGHLIEENLFNFQSEIHLPEECTLVADRQLQGCYSAYYHNSKNKIEFVLNNPQGRNLARQVINTLETKEINKFTKKLLPESKHLLDSYMSASWDHYALNLLGLKKAKAAHDFISKLEASND